MLLRPESKARATNAGIRPEHCFSVNEIKAARIANGDNYSETTLYIFSGKLALHLSLHRLLRDLPWRDLPSPRLTFVRDTVLSLPF